MVFSAHSIEEFREYANNENEYYMHTIVLGSFFFNQRIHVDVSKKIVEVFVD